MNPSTEEDIARVRELDAKATKGPWITGSIPWKVWANGGYNTVCDVGACGDAVPVPDCPQLSTSDSMAANRDLIAAYRTLAPRLATDLENALAALRWLPIDQAPKDGTVILGWRFGPIAMYWNDKAPRWKWECVDFNSGIPFKPNGFEENDSGLTHFMPLPLPPKEQL